jgi:AMMECR1 domain-containing protein
VPQLDTISNITKNKSGAILKNGRNNATYLPQVWDDLTDPNQFFTSLGLKGEMSADFFDDDATKIYSYQAIVFHE